MINKFLSAKHWHLFIPMFAIPFIIQTLMMQQMLGSFTDALEQPGAPPALPEFTNLFMVNIGVTLLYMILFYAWLWSIGFGLQSKIPSTINMKLGKFKFAIIFPMIYMPILIYLISSIMTDPLDFNFGYFAVIIPVHFIAMICIFYTLYFAAKTIKTAEVKEELRFIDFVAEFLLLWVYPVGVWILQPRINALHASELDEGIEQHLID